MTFYRPIDPLRPPRPAPPGAAMGGGDDAATAPAEMLERLTTELLAALDRFLSDQNAHLLGLQLSRVLTLLRLQIARADDGLRAMVAGQEDAALARGVRARAEEMQAVGHSLERFAGRYGDVGSAISDLPNFRHDIRMLVGQLAERVEHERHSRPCLAAPPSPSPSPGLDEE